MCDPRKWMKFLFVLDFKVGQNPASARCIDRLRPAGPGRAERADEKHILGPKASF